MSEATKLLGQAVEYGAVLSVSFGDGRRLGPWPIDYLKVDEEAGTLEYLWIGSEERLHRHEPIELEALDDGQVRIELPGLGEILVEPAWDPRDHASLAEWVAMVRADPGIRNYPDGGWRYGAL